MIILGTNSIKDTGYNVANSLRFDGASSAYLNRTHGASGSTRKMTISFWIKKCVSKDHGQADGLMILGGQQDSYPGFLCIFNRATDTFIFRDARATNDVKFDVRTDALFRDFSAWSHIVVALDTTQGTASNRIKLYINGTQTTDLNGSTTSGAGSDNPLYPDQNLDTLFNGNEAHFINKYASNYEDFYLCEYCFIDGSQLAPTSFGEFDSDSGIWKPIDVSGLTFGTNGFYLDFEDSSDLGNDASGSNNWTSNNLAATDQSLDTCTNNFATMNPLIYESRNNTFAEGNLKITGGTADGWANKYGVSSMAVSSGKWFVEAKATTMVTSQGVLGIMGTSTALAGSMRDIGLANIDSGGRISGGGGDHQTGLTSFSNGDIAGVAFDADNGTIQFYRNGSTYGNAVSSIASDTYYFVTNSYEQGAVMEFNFGSPPYSESGGNSDGNGYGNFSMAVPSGYFALNTKNLAEYG